MRVLSRSSWIRPVTDEAQLRLLPPFVARLDETVPSFPETNVTPGPQTHFASAATHAGMNYDDRNREVFQYLQGLWLYRAGRRRQGRVRARHCRGSGRHALADGRPEGLLRCGARRPWRQGG